MDRKINEQVNSFLNTKLGSSLQTTLPEKLIMSLKPTLPPAKPSEVAPNNENGNQSFAATDGESQT